VPAGAEWDATLRRQPHVGTAFNPAKTSPASWDAFSDVEAFVDAVLAELAAMAADGTRRTRSGLHIFIDFGQLCSSKPTAHVHGNRTAVFMISAACFQAGQHTCKAS